MKYGNDLVIGPRGLDIPDHCILAGESHCEGDSRRDPYPSVIGHQTYEGDRRKDPL